MYYWLIDNKELVKVFYGLIVGLICLVIVLKTHRLHKISMHKGIRYFRNAFLFYGIAFIVRYVLAGLMKYNYISKGFTFLISPIFEFFLIMAGFFLLYSLLWKKIEHTDGNYLSSLLNSKILIFYLMAIVFVVLDYIWQTHSFMFFSQVILFLFASIISYANYAEKGSKHKFLKFYFIAMLLSLGAWVLNAIAALYFSWNQEIVVSSYVLNSIIFLLFLWGVNKVTR